MTYQYIYNKIANVKTVTSSNVGEDEEKQKIYYQRECKMVQLLGKSRLAVSSKTCNYYTTQKLKS